MHRTHRSRQRGFTLIEVMIAMIILAVGLLGMASLMAHSQKSTESAYSRSQATLLAYDLVERMRSNLVDPEDTGKNYKVLYVTDPRSNKKTGNTGNYELANLPDCSAPSGAVPAGGASRASYDIAAWCATLKSSLPGVDTANTKVSFQTGTQYEDFGIATVTVKIQWLDNSAGEDSQAQYVEVVTTL